MRVVMVSGSYPPQPCGVGDYTKRLVEELRKAGISVDVVTTETSNRTSADPVKYTLRKWTIRNWIAALRWLRPERYDIMHIQYPARFYGYRPSLGLLTILAKVFIPGLPVVISLHEFRITHLLRKLTSVALLSPASAILLTAGSERTAVERWMPWVRSRVHILPLATTVPEVRTNKERRSQVRRSYGISDEETVVVYFGLLHPNKGIEKLLQSFHAVHQKNSRTRLLMLSLYEPSITPYHASLRETVARLKIADAVVWAGYLDNPGVSEHLACADVGFFPFQDGVTLRRSSFITAMAHGLPILTTSGHAGTSEIGLQDGENALIVRAEASAEEMADRLLALAEDPPLRARLASGARVWTGPFQWKKILEKLLTIYGHIAGASNVTTHHDG
jgi:polysaccharide biosynthesis protein PslF